MSQCRTCSGFDGFHYTWCRKYCDDVDGHSALVDGPDGVKEIRIHYAGIDTARHNVGVDRNTSWPEPATDRSLARPQVPSRSEDPRATVIIRLEQPQPCDPASMAIEARAAVKAALEAE